MIVNKNKRTPDNLSDRIVQVTMTKDWRMKSECKDEGKRDASNSSLSNWIQSVRWSHLCDKNQNENIEFETGFNHSTKLPDAGLGKARLG